MNTRKSDLFDLDENIAALLVAVVPLAVSMIGFVSYVAWVVPLAALLMEKHSGLVRITAGQMLALTVAMTACAACRGIVNDVWEGEGLFFIPRMLMGMSFSLAQIACLVLGIVVGYHAYHGRIFEIPRVTAWIRSQIHSDGTNF